MFKAGPMPNIHYQNCMACGELVFDGQNHQCSPSKVYKAQPHDYLDETGWPLFEKREKKKIINIVDEDNDLIASISGDNVILHNDYRMIETEE